MKGYDIMKETPPNTTIFRVVISGEDSLVREEIRKLGKHRDQTLMTVCIGVKEGSVPHMHIFRGAPLNCSVIWGTSTRLQFKKAQYFEEVTDKQKLTKKEIRTLATRLREPYYANPKHTLWVELINQWNTENFKVKGDAKNGWLDPDTPIPEYEAGISEYK